MSCVAEVVQSRRRSGGREWNGVGGSSECVAGAMATQFCLLVCDTLVSLTSAVIGIDIGIRIDWLATTVLYGGVWWRKGKWSRVSRERECRAEGDT